MSKSKQSFRSNFDSIGDIEQKEIIEANKNDNGKLRMDLIPVSAIEGLAEVLTHGALKYGDNNWRKGLTWGRCFGATMRHLWAFWSGEDIDKDSGIHHLKLVMCEIAFLLEFTKTHPELDDRWRKI